MRKKKSKRRKNLRLSVISSRLNVSLKKPKNDLQTYIYANQLYSSNISIIDESFASFFESLSSLSPLILFRSDRFNFMFMILSLSNLNKFSLGETNIVLSWSVDVVLIISKKFYPMSYPSCHSGNSEKNWEHIGWETHCAID